MNYRIKVMIEDEDGINVVSISDAVYANDEDTVAIAYRALAALKEQEKKEDANEIDL